jgi:hypothetical protein
VVGGVAGVVVGGVAGVVVEVWWVWLSGGGWYGECDEHRVGVACMVWV